MSGVFGQFEFTIPNAQLHVDEIRRFHDQLRTLYDELNCDAHLESIDGWVKVAIIADGSGRLRIVGHVYDAVPTGNRLDFSITDHDQTDLPPLLADLSRVCSAFS